jgi:GNAT superfamily N-acetyltransferase
MSVTIRPVVTGDIADMLGMIAALSAHHDDVATVTCVELERDVCGPDPWAIGLIVRDGTRAVGYAILSRLIWLQRGERGFDIHHLYVVDDLRGQGVGRALIMAAADTARAYGCNDLRISAAPTNADAQAAYLACGFAPAPNSAARFLMPLGQAGAATS